MTWMDQQLRLWTRTDCLMLGLTVGVAAALSYRVWGLW